MNIKYLFVKLLKKMRGAAIKGSIIHGTSKAEAGSVIINCSFDKYSYCGYDCEIINTRIGAFCSIANNVVIGGANHPIHWVGMSPAFYSGRDSIKKKFSTYDRPLDKVTTIGNDVWIGQYAIIKQGVNIGNGAVIGMGSVVTKDVPSYAIVAGNPAKLIRLRFSTDIIERLENAKWWELPEYKLEEAAQYIKSPNDFLQEIGY